MLPWPAVVMETAVMDDLRSLMHRIATGQLGPTLATRMYKPVDCSITPEHRKQRRTFGTKQINIIHDLQGDKTIYRESEC